MIIADIPEGSWEGWAKMSQGGTKWHHITEDPFNPHRWSRGCNTRYRFDQSRIAEFTNVTPSTEICSQGGCRKWATRPLI